MPRHYTGRRFARLMLTLNRLTCHRWIAKLTDDGHSINHYQRRREKLIKVLERELDEMCFYGVHA